MIAADTTRSRAYLQALVRHELFPNHVLVLNDKINQYLPGQVLSSEEHRINMENESHDECWSESNFKIHEPILSTLTMYDINHEITGHHDINTSIVVDNVRSRPEQVFIYSGFGGVILRDDILETGKQFLHVHGGYLPDYKGSTTNYYSLIIEEMIGASSLFLNSEIDSGHVLIRKKFPPPPNRQEMDHIFDSAARSKVLVDTIQSYLKKGGWDFDKDADRDGETYYIIHPVLKHIAILAKNDVSV